MDLSLAHEMSMNVLANFGVRAEFFIGDIPFLGVCEFPSKDKKYGRIGLQSRFVSLNNPFMIIDTVLHEIGHYLVGFREEAHDKVWEAKYLSLGGMGVELADAIVVTDNEKWTSVCSRCETLNTTDDDINLINFAEEMICCKKCDEELVKNSWVKFSGYELCGASTMKITPQNITTTGRKLLEGAMKYDRGLVR